MLVFIGKLSLSTNIWVPICQGFSHFSAFFHIINYWPNSPPWEGIFHENLITLQESDQSLPWLLANHLKRTSVSTQPMDCSHLFKVLNILKTSLAELKLYLIPALPSIHPLMSHSREQKCVLERNQSIQITGIHRLLWAGRYVPDHTKDVSRKDLDACGCIQIIGIHKLIWTGDMY